MRSAWLILALAWGSAHGETISYEGAQRLVLTGKFSEALPHLEALAATTADPVERARILLLAELCRTWAAGGYTLVASAGADAPRAQSVRTTGEMARVYIDGVLYGVGTGGYFALLGDADSATWVVLPMLLSAGVVSGALAWVDAEDLFAYGHPRAISAGLRIGVMEGLAWMTWYQSQARYDDELSEKQSGSLIWGLTTAGVATGAILGSQLRTTPGRIAFIESGALWSGAVVGLTAAAIAGEEDTADDAFMLATAIALNLGAGAAAWLSGEFDPSADRALYLDLGGIAGGLVAGGLYIAAADEDAEVRPGAALTAAGIVGGLATAWLLTRHLPPDPPRAGGPTLGFGVAPLEGGGLLAVGGWL